VAKRHELEPRAVIAERMRTRKLANTQTSIRFGFDKDDWQTDAQRRQKDILGVSARELGWASAPASSRSLEAAQREMHECAPACGRPPAAFALARGLSGGDRPNPPAAGARAKSPPL
jgi:hypothetical protein